MPDKHVALDPSALGLLAQKTLFARIKDVLPTYTTLVDEVAEALEVSTDSVYRRMRGEKQLSLDEALRLCVRFKITLEALAVGSADSVAFTYNRLRSADDFERYLQGMADLLGMMVHAERSGMVYGAADISIFHYFRYPEFMAFKYFYWQQAVMGLPELQGKKFSLDLVPEKLMRIGQDIHKRYFAVPSTEIWTGESSLTTVRQLAYYYDSGQFADKATARQVTTQLRQTIAEVVRMAERDSKDEAGKVPYKLYESEIQIGNNCVLASLNDTRVTYVSHQTFNVMTTFNPNFCDDTEAFLKGLIKRSMLISGVSERQRLQFFNRLVAPVDALLERMG